MAITILVTGGTGLLGSEINSYFSGLTAYKLLLPSMDEFDVLNRKQVHTYISIHSPDIIIHTAAHTNLEEAEEHPDLAHRINTMGTLSICNAILGTDIKLIYISSTGIYGTGKNTPWREYEAVNPTTVHHMSKLAGERVVKNHINNYIILRTGWLFGGSLKNKKNFIHNRYKEALKHEIVYANDQQYGNPTSAFELAKQIEVLISNNIIGTFNAVNKGVVNRLEYIARIYQDFKLPNSVKPVKGEFKRVAKVSNNESAENYYLDLLGLNNMSHFKEPLSNYIKSIVTELNEQ
jgi:dTDP-4-dehydrorhamnose reductase